MTPFRNDAANPWSRESVWPHLPVTPLKLGGWRPAPPPRTEAPPAPPPPAALEPQPTVARPEPPLLAPPPFAPSPRLAATTGAIRRDRPSRRALRVTPLVAAGAVGAGGGLALFLLIGVARPPAAAPTEPPATASTLAVGQLIGGTAAPQPAAAPMPTPTLTAPPGPRTAPARLPAAARPPHLDVASALVPASSIGRLELPQPQPLLIPPLPAQAQAGPAPDAAPARPVAPPDRDAPMPRRIPDPD
ncbi:hypothetical protein [Phenylobacterium sp.]|jgi:hypothetical protein|uniref:hypothetical protein n=1 Tax=Phenylobacterium sp. TaxID=1871053 RepID=UPI002E3432FD|nr:hypothetical protein [Phenylobacterium sp.]HEX3366679.1 hypothetical protein [Phenylobacterium sp.]